MLGFRVRIVHTNGFFRGKTYQNCEAAFPIYAVITVTSWLVLGPILAGRGGVR